MPRPRKDYSHLVGQRFGMLTITELLPREMGRKPKARTRCQCGTVSDHVIVDLVRGKVKSCGCQLLMRRTITHGASRGQIRTTEYHSWQAIKNRCGNPKTPAFSRYGGRGITVCDRWRESFEAFLEDVGLKPTPDMSIDRIDNNRGYEPGNVRWADAHTQNNNRRDTLLVTIDGVTKSIADWSVHLGIKSGTVYSRVRKGMDAAEALLTPVVKPIKENIK